MNSVVSEEKKKESFIKKPVPKRFESKKIVKKQFKTLIVPKIEQKTPNESQDTLVIFIYYLEK